MSYFVDSNIFLRTIEAPRSAVYQDCRHFIELINQAKIQAFTNSLVVAEIVWVCGAFYKLSKSEIVLFIEGLLVLPGLKIQDSFQPELALELYRNLNINFIDALIASQPQIYHKKMVVVSYDKDFDRIGVVRKEPKEIKI